MMLMNSETENDVFIRRVLHILSKSGIISLDTIQSIAMDMNIKNYTQVFKKYAAESKLKKDFVVECPICHMELGNEDNFDIGDEIICPYGNHSFNYNRRHTRLFFSTNLTTNPHSGQILHHLN